MNLERQAGPWTLRVWWLVGNLLSNALALYGLAGYFRGGDGIAPLIGGSVLTGICIWILSAPVAETPSSDRDTPERALTTPDRGTLTERIGE